MGKYCDTDFYAQISCISYMKKMKSEIFNDYPYTLIGKTTKDIFQL